VTEISLQELIVSIITTSKRRFPAAVAAAVIFTATLALSGFAGPASADERGREHRDYHHRDWNGGYYRAPPVVYGSPYYYAPPVIYGPGLNINIR
jgi:hypothetical protein